MASLTNWKPYSQKVDNSSRAEGKFMSGAFTLLAAGPPRLANVGGAAAAAIGLGSSSSGRGGDNTTGGQNWALPIGIVQSFNLGHNRSFNRFWELGSERSYFISGRTVAQAGFGRVLYNGPSLLRIMYAFYADLVPPTIMESIGGILENTQTNQHDVRIPPGYENIFLNLASDLFSQPCGLLVYMKDSNENTMGAVYLEETYIPSHSIATDAQGVVMQEQVSLQPERVVPVAVNAIALFSTLDDLLA
jgi:hypothetical protein